MMESSYPAPVNQLLSLGELSDDERHDYVALGISPENIPDLIRLATDEELYNSANDNPVVWASVHAWRALGQLRATQAVAPLLLLFQRIEDYGDDWAQTDLPAALAQIGASVIKPAVNYLADTNRDEWARIAAAETLGQIGLVHPDLRAECVGKLAAQLEKFPEQSETFNAFLISPLWELRAVEAMPLIERAFAAGCVDESVLGDVEDVQIHFGLKTEREHPFKSNPMIGIDDRVAGWEEELHAFAQGNAALHSLLAKSVPEQPYLAPVKIGRNDPCPCGSGKKYKKCCGV